MADDVRVTIGVSPKAKDNWTKCAKALSISQWEMTEVLFRLADPTDQRIRDLALQVVAKNSLLKEKSKELAKKFKMLTPEQLEMILAS